MLTDTVLKQKSLACIKFVKTIDVFNKVKTLEYLLSEKNTFILEVSLFNVFNFFSELRVLATLILINLTRNSKLFVHTYQKTIFQQLKIVPWIKTKKA